MISPHDLESFRPRLLCIARRKLERSEDAEDAVQLALIKAWIHIDQFESERSSLYTWLLRITLNTAVDLARDRLRHPEPLSLDSFDYSNEPADPAISADPERLAVRAESIARVRGAVEKLPARLRDTCNLLELYELRQDEVASILQIPQGTVKSRASRARKLLRYMLTP